MKKLISILAPINFTFIAISIFASIPRALRRSVVIAAKAANTVRCENTSQSIMTFSDPLPETDTRSRFGRARDCDIHWEVDCLRFFHVICYCVRVRVVNFLTERQAEEIDSFTHLVVKLFRLKVVKLARVCLLKTNVNCEVDLFGWCYWLPEATSWVANRAGFGDFDRSHLVCEIEVFQRDTRKC